MSAGTPPWVRDNSSGPSLDSKKSQNLVVLLTQVTDGGRKSGEILLTEFLAKKNVLLCFLKEVFVENTFQALLSKALWVNWS